MESSVNQFTASSKLIKNNISVVTPTLMRPNEVVELIQNLSEQTVQPFEFILVDGAPEHENKTEISVAEMTDHFSFTIKYIRHSGGTAIQRNIGIDAVSGDFIAFIDDDVRLDFDFFQNIMEVFIYDESHDVGGVVGYRKNEYFSLETHTRWRFYKHLKLLKIFKPGMYDFECGYPINNNMQPPFSGVREVDFMTTACAVWRSEVVQDGLRFDPFFIDYGILEDAHFSLLAAKKWKLLQCGDAKCIELQASGGRSKQWIIGYKCVVNYYYVFNDICGPLTSIKKIRFFRFQIFELFRVFTAFIRKMQIGYLNNFVGRLFGLWVIFRGRWKKILIVD